MSALLRGLRIRLRALLRPQVARRELDEEMRLHLELETEANRRRGMNPVEARRQAAVTFGGLDVAKEAHRDALGVRWIEDTITDARFALRTLAKNPVLSGAAMLTIALGIGANTAIFSVVNAVILRPLPFPHADQLVMLSEDNPEKGWRRQTAAPANYLDWKERVHAFADVAAYEPGGGATMTGEGEPQRISLRGVTGNYFTVLGVRPALGRTFTPRETWQSGAPVAVISDRMWRDVFGAVPTAVGKSVAINGTRTEIVGVMPASFSYAADTVDVWRPVAWDPQNRGQVFFRRAHWLRVIARLKVGVTPRAADAEFQTVVRQLQTEYAETNRLMGADLVPLHEFLIGDVRTPLLLLQVAVGLLLLIACANVGNILLVQAVGREREASLRLTLGAGRGRLVRQALTESLVLSALGGIAGVTLGWWGTRLFAALQPNGMLPVANVRLDVRVLVAMVVLTTATGLLFGIAPALWSARRLPAEVLREGERGTSQRVRRWGDLLVVGELAFALMLTVGAGLLLQSVRRLEQVDPGVDARGVLAVGISLPSGYDSTPQQIAFFDALRENVRALPGVTDAGLTLVPPFGGVGYTSDYHIGGRPANEYGTEIAHDYVSPEYFSTLHIPLLAGRLLTAADRAGAVPVVVINQALARKYFHGEDPVGQRITFDKIPDSTSVWRTIVGVVGDVRQQGLAVEPLIEAYEAFAQNGNSYMTLLVRTGGSGDVRALVPAIRNVVARLDPTLALAQVQSLEHMERRSIASQRFIMLLLVVFAAAGFVLAMVGVYAVMAQLGRRRTREMGIRIALGARMGEVQWLVVRHGLRLVGAGLTIGAAGALAATRAIRALLYQVSPGDPPTFLAVLVLLTLTALAASWLPAARASRADPAMALRAE
jgi:putative ABC transport system permease protein